MSRNAARQRGIIMDVELQKMKERVIDRFEGAVDVWKLQQRYAHSNQGIGMPFSTPK